MSIEDNAKLVTEVTKQILKEANMVLVEAGPNKKSLRDMGSGPGFTSVVGRQPVKEVGGAARRAQIPPECMDAKIGGVQDATVRSVLEKYIAGINSFLESGSGLIVSGDVGTGKTAIAAIVGLAAIRAGFSVLMITHSELQELQFKDSANPDGQFGKERLRTVDLLIIDGLNENFVVDNKFSKEHAEELISKRSGWKRATLITTRLTPPVMAKELKTLYSVMQGAMVGLRINGEDLRKQKNLELKRKLGLEK